MTPRYRVYRNLNRGDWTVQHKTAKGWRKLMGLDALFAPYVEFRVYEAGRWRAQREGTKNVHAYAIVEEFEHLMLPLTIVSTNEMITYSPFTPSRFESEGADNLTSAVDCTFHPSGVVYARSVSGT